mgnify:CR=1 FL=1
MGQIFGLVLVQRGWIGYENVSYMMLIGMVAFWWLWCVPFDCHCPDNGDYRSFRGVLSFHRGRWVDLLFHRIVTDKTFNVLLYDRMFRSHNPKSSEGAGARYHLFVEIMDGSYFDGKEVDTLALPNHWYHS